MSNDAGVNCEVVADCFGYAYVSGNGLLVIDRHATDEEHLLARSEREEQPLHDCRIYVSDLVPREWLSRFSRFTVRRTVNDEGEVTSVEIRFCPT